VEGTGTTARGDPAAPQRRGAPWLRRLLFAQETGLVLVIVVFAVWLTVSGGTKPRLEQEAIPPGTSVVQTAAGFSVMRDGALVREYPAAEGWSLREGGDAPAAFRRVEVNKFLDLTNLVLLAKDASFIVIMAVGMTAIIVMGGIDLSVGSIYALAAVLGALALRAVNGDGGAPWWIAIPVGLGVCCAVGAACGLANGAMIVGLRVHPFIITLGTMAVVRGLVFLQTRGDSIMGFPPSFTAGFFKATIAGVEPVPVMVMAVVVAVGAVVLGHTVLGRRVYAIGGNETAAVYAGVPVGRVKIVVYTLCGMLAGLSASVYLGYLGAASPDAGNGYELSVIAATVIGGASLSGGRGSALGALLGAILIQLISNAMIILAIDTSYTQVVMGAAIIVAVVLDQAKSRLTRRGA
jgi:ribose transport system permease protein